MVQFFAPLLWIVGLAISVGLATPYKRTIDQFQQDITTLTSQTDMLNSALDAFSNPGGTMTQLLRIQSATTNILTSIATATIHVGDIIPPVSDDDGRLILNRLEALKPSILTALATLVDKKPAFDAFVLLPASTIALSTLKQLATATATLETTLLVLAPNNVVAEATTQRTEVDNAFNQAIHDFGS